HVLGHLDQPRHALLDGVALRAGGAAQCPPEDADGVLFVDLDDLDVTPALGARELLGETRPHGGSSDGGVSLMHLILPRWSKVTMEIPGSSSLFRHPGTGKLERPKWWKLSVSSAW